MNITEEQRTKVKQALALMNSMIKSGEPHTAQSIAVFNNAIKIANSIKTKVFKLHVDDDYYIYSGKNEGEAKQALFEDIGTATICDIEEIPESEWDKKTINMWEGNDFEKKPYKVSIRDNMSGDTPIQICTSNIDF